MAEPKTISYEAHREAMENLKWAHEQEAVRQSYVIKRLWILCMTIFITLVVVCVAIVHYESQWEVVEETTETVTQNVEASGDSDAVLAGIGDAFNGMCYEPLAEKYDVSVTTIKNIIYKNENRIFKHLRV